MLKTPHLKYLVQRIRISYYKILSENNYCGSAPIINQPVLLAGKGKITFEKPVFLGFEESPFFYSGYIYLDARGDNSEIKMGKNTWVNNNASIIAEHGKITIGRNVLVGPNFQVFNSDFHNLDPTKRMSTECERKDVAIGDNVFLGSNITVLKGVVIGRNSVIGSGSIVTNKIPENVVAAGIPCRVLRKISTKENIN